MGYCKWQKGSKKANRDKKSISIKLINKSRITACANYSFWIKMCEVGGIDRYLNSD
jgi:hypothetical protein